MPHTGMTTSTWMSSSSMMVRTSSANNSPMAIRLRYTLTPSKTESGRAKYTYSKMSGAKGEPGARRRRLNEFRVTMTASPIPENQASAVDPPVHSRKVRRTRLDVLPVSESTGVGDHALARK